MHFADHYKKFQWKQSWQLVGARKFLSSPLFWLAMSEDCSVFIDIANGLHIAGN